MWMNTICFGQMSSVDLCKMFLTLLYETYLNTATGKGSDVGTFQSISRVNRDAKHCFVWAHLWMLCSHLAHVVAPQISVAGSTSFVRFTEGIYY